MSDTPITTQWHLPETPPEKLHEFFNQNDLSGVLGELLYTRNPGSSDALVDFLNPIQTPLSDPFLLTDMQAAVDRIKSALEKQEHIRIIGDYDVDGISATALLYRGLRRFGIEEISYALPDRLGDGYGLNLRLIDEAIKDGVKLIITVDNGIMAHDEAEHARKNALDLIITDHHSLGESIPVAEAVINPKRDPEDSPFANSCGTAVAFELCSALNGANDDLALVAIATIADVMPLTGENRQLTARGLEEIQRRQQPGIQALLRVARLQPNTTRAQDIAFQVAPRINASGRLGNGGSALQLLLTDDSDEANYLADELNRINEERKQVEQLITEQAFEQLVNNGLAEKRTIILASREWHPGVIGIVASKLQHRHHKPVVLIAVDEDGVGRGSGRSNDHFSLIDAFTHCSDHFVKYGGHRNAAGMTINESEIESLREAFELFAEAQDAPISPVRTIHIDALLPFTEIGPDLLSDLDRLEPLGHANHPPLFATFGAQLLPGSLRALNGGHLQCSIQQDNRTFKAIGFNMADRIDMDTPPKKVDISFVPKYNEWKGNTTIQLHLTDIKDSKNNPISTDSV